MAASEKSPRKARPPPLSTDRPSDTDRHSRFPTVTCPTLRHSREGGSPSKVQNDGGARPKFGGSPARCMDPRLRGDDGLGEAMAASEKSPREARPPPLSTPRPSDTDRHSRFPTVTCPTLRHSREGGSPSKVRLISEARPTSSVPTPPRMDPRLRGDDGGGRASQRSDRRARSCARRKSAARKKARAPAPRQPSRCGVLKQCGARRLQSWRAQVRM
jgi:hypothetical protein